MAKMLLCRGEERWEKVWHVCVCVCWPDQYICIHSGQQKEPIIIKEAAANLFASGQKMSYGRL